MGSFTVAVLDTAHFWGIYFNCSLMYLIMSVFSVSNNLIKVSFPLFFQILAPCLTWNMTSRTSSLTPPTWAFLTGWSCTPLWVEEGCWALWVARVRTQRPNTSTCLSSSALAPLHPPPQPPANLVTHSPWG